MGRGQLLITQPFESLCEVSLIFLPTLFSERPKIGPIRAVGMKQGAGQRQARTGLLVLACISCSPTLFWGELHQKSKLKKAERRKKSGSSCTILCKCPDP